jgi:hypothetical protein
MKIFLAFMLFSLLVSCIGPVLITFGGFKVTSGTVITIPSKIEAYEKYKEKKDEEKKK